MPGSKVKIDIPNQLPESGLTRVQFKSWKEAMCTYLKQSVDYLPFFFLTHLMIPSLNIEYGKLPTNVQIELNLWTHTILLTRKLMVEKPYLQNVVEIWPLCLVS